MSAVTYNSDTFVKRTVIPISGEPEFEPTYYSKLRNYDQALTGAGLLGTIGSIKSTFQNYINTAPGPRNVVQLDLPDGTKYHSHDLEWLRFQLDVADDLSPLKVSDQSETAVLDLGLTRDFSKTFTNGSRVMNPALSPRMDVIGKSPAELPAEYIMILSMLTEIYTEKWKPTAIRFNNKSHFGLPYPTYKKQDKLDIFRKEIIPLGAQFAERLVDIDGGWFVEKMGSYPITKITYRVQLDSIGKIRAGNDWLGFLVESADKELEASENFGLGKMVRARQRNAYAVSGVANAPAQCMFAGWRSIALHRYNLTWHTSVDSDLLGPITKYGHFRSYDAANFDTTFDWLEICTIIDSLQGATPLFKEYVKRVARLPLLVKSDTEGVVGSYLLNIANYTGGHQSGVAWVSDFNKIRGTAQWLYGLFKLGRFSVFDKVKAKDYMRKFLRHEDQEFAMLNQGDDSLPLARNPVQLDKWVSIVENLPFAKWEEDPGKKFIGKVIYQDYAGGELRVIPDIVTAVEKLLINERSVHSKHRKMSSMGNLARIDEMEKHPAYGPVFDVIDRRAIEHFGATLKDLYRRTLHLDIVDTPDLEGVTGFNWETLQFIQDEDVIHYKVDPAKIDPRVLKQRMSTFSANECVNVVNEFQFMESSYFSNHTIH
jgi:hypothetical protein